MRRTRYAEEDGSLKIIIFYKNSMSKGSSSLHSLKQSKLWQSFVSKRKSECFETMARFESKSMSASQPARPAGRPSIKILHE